MDMYEYQNLASRTNQPYQPYISILGLTGEAGEVADYMKKVWGHGHDFDRDVLIKELGDVLWYLSDICTKFDIQLEEVARKNIIKLQSRYPDGFSSENSRNRNE